MIDQHRSIIDFRNIVVHEYSIVDDELVWSIVQKGVPLLKDQAQEALDKLSIED